VSADNSQTMFTPYEPGSDMFPWVRCACEAYAKRMRVTNFTKAGNAMFHNMLFRAIYGDPVYFTMVENGRVEKKIPVSKPNPQSQSSFAKNSDDEVLDDTNVDDNGTQTVSNIDESDDSVSYESIQEQYVIQSGVDPVDLSSLKNDEYAERLSSVANVGATNGVCYDDKDNPIDGIWCLFLPNPPVSDSACNIAQSVMDINAYVNSNLDRILVPNRYAANTDPETEWDERKPDSKHDTGAPSVEPDPRSPRKLTHVDSAGAGTPAITLGQFAQWDNTQIQAMKQAKALEFMGETNIPPSDLPELQTLSLTAQSLVSNREPYVSRVAAIKAQVEAVFQSAGVPELQWDILFPYTPQDIASIGDALGKGATPQVLSQYQLS
jgi:hypothetical protein